MKVILDTSIWIEFFKGKEDYYEKCQSLIEQDDVYTIDLIFAELIQGARSNRELDLLKNFYKWIPKIYIQDLIILSGE